VRECHPTADSYEVSRSASHYPRWWFVLAFWRTIPIVVSLVVGYAIGYPALGALLGLAFLLSGFGFSRWVAKSEARQSDERLLRAFAVYFAAMAAVLVIVLATWLIVELA
jgi:uncharacterized membrane protein